jgi:signal transduction histidine kinase
MDGRRRVMFWAGTVYAAILVVVASGMLLLYQGSRQHLDETLGQRLLAVATTTAQLVDGDAVPGWSFDPEPDLELLWLASRIEQIRLDNELSEITLCDLDGHVLVSASGRLDRGDVNVFWEVDRASVALARKGLPAAGSLYQSGPLYQKSAHAPVLNRYAEIAGIVTVEGNADFLGSLAALRRGAVAIIAAVIAGLAVLGLLLWRSQRSLERARAGLMQQENLAAMGRMTAGIAHEIRNPLGIIRGSGQHLQRLLAEHGIEDEVADFIPEEIDRLDRILGDYLSFGSDRASRLDDLDLAALIRRTVKLMDAELSHTGVRAVLSESLPEAWIRGDRQRLQQILVNLLLNARDAMPAGGAVTLSLAEDDGYWKLIVVDGGHGLGDADREKVFAPFWTSKEKGGGLGLTVSRRIAEQHGGTLTLSNRPDGRGCEARLTIPRVSPPVRT